MTNVFMVDAQVIPAAHLVRVVLVGNAPATADLSHVIDSADVVVRFNDMVGHGGRYGTKTSFVYLCNMGPPSRRLLRTADLHQRIADSGCRSVVLTYPAMTRAEIVTHFLRGNRRRITDRSADWRQVFDALGVPTLRVAMQAQAELTQRMRDVEGFAAFEAQRRYWAPSSGAMALAHVARILGGAEPVFELVGFTFRGWDGHPWFAERALAEDLRTAGRLRLLDGRGSSGDEEPRAEMGLTGRSAPRAGQLCQ